MSRLHKAAEAANIEEVRKLISEGADVNEYDSVGDLPIHSLITKYSVNTNNLTRVIEILDELLAAGADINAKQNGGQKWTVLHWTARVKNSELVKALLQRNASVHSLDWLVRTPLHLTVNDGEFRASYEDQYATAELLLQQGASINAIDKIGTKPTTWGEDSRNPNLHQLLLTYGVPAIEKTEYEKKLAALVNKASFFVEPGHKRQYSPKSLTELAAQMAIKVRYNEHLPKNYYEKLLKLAPAVRDRYPELEMDYKKLFVYKVNKIIERAGSPLDETKDSQEIAYLKKIKTALSADHPYNAVHKIIQELDKKMRQGFLSVFKNHMQPVRSQIVQAMKEYSKDKSFYEQHIRKTNPVNEIT